MYSYFTRDDVALHGFAAHFKKESLEERQHAELLMNFQTLRGGRVKLLPIISPESEFAGGAKGDALYAMELALSLEKLNFHKLLALHGVADAAGDVHVRGGGGLGGAEGGAEGGPAGGPEGGGRRWGGGRRRGRPRRHRPAEDGCGGQATRPAPPTPHAPCPPCPDGGLYRGRAAAGPGGGCQEGGRRWGHGSGRPGRRPPPARAGPAEAPSPPPLPSIPQIADYVAQLRRVGTGLGVYEFDKKLGEAAV